MNKKRFNLIITSIAFILLVFSTTIRVKADYTMVDETQDIIQMSHGVTPALDLDVAPKIDIVSLVINESAMAVSFVATPVLHINNFYDIIIYWNSDDVQNFTDGHWNQGNVISQTKLINSTGEIIVNTKANDSIVLIDNTLYFPILNASYITGISSPVTGIVDCRQRISVDGFEFYRDVLDFGNRSVPGYTFLLSIISIATMMIIIIRKKKKR